VRRTPGSERGTSRRPCVILWVAFDARDEFHVERDRLFQAEVMSIRLRATTNRSHLASPLVVRMGCIAVLLASSIPNSGNPIPSWLAAPSRAQQEVNSEQGSNVRVHPYMDEPLKQLVKHVPELKGIRPAANQLDLPVILRKTGEEVDEFFDNAVDLEAREEIRQERDGEFGSGRREPMRDNYLILRHGDDTGADFDEFRMDEKGNRMDEQDFGRGFLVTSGFALICVQFSTPYQWDSRFLYLGQQRIAGRETYVVAFAQIPGKAGLNVTLRGPSGNGVPMLTQGIAWVDRENFHILRMRTDLLDPPAEIGLEAQTTKISFSEVRFLDVATPLWLPREVSVYVKLGKNADRPAELEFRNVHHYTDYRRYRVSTKMVAPQ
jgi:hypothetical protein